MDAIPVFALFVPYFLVLFLSGLFLFFNVFHLWRYGVEGIGTALLLFAYISLFFLIAGGSWVLLSGYALDGTFALTDLLPSFSGVNSFGL